MRINWFKTGGLSLASLMLFGCGSIDVTGVVRDETTQRPIEGAVVRIGDKSTATDSSGFYSMEVDADDEDTQRFSVAAPGYVPVSDVRLVDEDVDPARIDFDLKSDVMDPSSSSYRPDNERVDVKVRADAGAQADGEVDTDSEKKDLRGGPVIDKPESGANRDEGARDTNDR